MSHPVNEIIKENHFEDALELSSAELVKELGVDLATRDFGNIAPHSIDSKVSVILAGVPKVPLKKVMSHDDLADMVANKRFEEGPDGPC